MKKLLAAALGALVFAGTAVADPLDPKVKSNVLDEAYAARAVVSRADLGNAWNGGKVNNPSLKQPVCPALRPNLSDLTLTGHAETAFDNGNGGVQVSSDVEVWKTKAQMRTHFARLLKPKVTECLRYNLRKSGLDASTIRTVTETPFPKLAPITAHFRVTVKVPQGTIFIDYLYLGKGRTQVYLNFVAPSIVRGLTALEQRIARAVLKRVRA
jgi:hypothetical protein